MSDLNTEIKIGADASGVEAGVGKAKRSLADLGASAKKAGQDAGAGMGAVGAGGDKAAREVERATKNIQGQLQRAVAAFEAGERGSRQFYESIARQRGVDVNALRPLLDQLDAVKSKSEAASQATVQMGSSFGGLGAAAGMAARAVAAIGIGVSVGEFVKMADASTNVASRLGLVTSSAAELASVQARLFQVAQSSRVSFVDLVGTYAQVARSTKDLGVSQNALLGVIQTISQAVTISGGSAASAQAALTQLSQGFASGALRGEELNSILEQTPRLAQALADGLGVGVGQLRELGKAGELTSEKVLGALEKSAASVAAEFNKMTVTVEQASTNAANSVLKLVGAFDKLTGVTSVLGGALQSISGGLDFISRDLEKLGSQGPLREAAREVINLDAQAKRLRNGMASGILGPNAQGELDRINARLAEAKKRFRELDQQISGAKDPRDQSGFTGRGTSYANEAKRQSQLSDDANSFRLKQSGVPEGYLKDMAELIRLNQAGKIVGDEYTAALKKQQDVLLQKTGVTKGVAAAANAEQNAYESLIASIRAKIEADKLELAGGSALTESQRLRIKLDQDLAAGRIKLGSANEKAVRLALEELSASEAAAAAAKAINKANLDAAQSRDKYITSLASGTEKIRADIQAQQDATQRMGLSKQAIAALDAAKLEMLATDTELQAIKVLDRNLDQKTYDALKEQADLYRDLAKAKQDGAAKEASIEYEKASADAAQKAQEDWRRAAEDINNSLTDALLRGFESGKDFAKNFRDTLVNMFKTLVLRPIISAVVSPVAGAITGALGLAGTANAGTSALGTVGNIASGARLLGGLGAFGGGLSGGFGGLMGSLGLSATGTTLGGALSAGSIALQSGNILGGLGTFAGALGPIALGIGALTSLLGSFKGETRTGGQFGVAFDGAVTNNRRGETYTYQGQQFDRDFSNGRRDALRDGQAYRLEGDPVAQESAIRDAVAGTAKGIDAFLEALGSSARLTGFSAGLETSGKGRGGVFSGGMLSNGQGFGESGKGDNYDGTLYEKFSTNSPDFKQALEDFTLDLKQSTIQALQSVTDIPEAIKKQLEGVDAESLTAEAADSLLTAINAQIVGVEQFRGALEAMGLEQFAGMAFDTAAAIAEAAGGFEALQTSVTGYYENYYSEAEKTALQTKMVKDALAEVGLEMPKTREEFRAMVEASLALGESGAEATAALLGVQDEFAAIAPQVQTLSDAFSVSGDTIKGILDDALANASSAAEASQMASDAFVDAMYSSINDAMTSNLSGLIMGAIQPMVDALIAGATTSGAAMAAGGAAGGGAVAAGGAAGGGAVAAGGATAGAVMAGVVEQARASISAWASVLSDPQIQASIQEIGNLVGGVAGVAYEVTGGAFNGGGSKWESPGSPSAPGGGADAYNDALKSIGDTIEDEVKRLRGLMVEDSPFSKESLMAQFATATAQARAGDKDALAKLPDLSKAIEAASAVTAVSAVEMARTRGWLAGSLEETLKSLGLTGAGGVTPVITAPTPTPAKPTTPQVIQPIYNPAISGATMDPALLAEVKALRQDLASLKTNDDQNHEEAQSMRLRLARSMERVENATVLQS